MITDAQLGMYAVCFFLSLLEIILLTLWLARLFTAAKLRSSILLPAILLMSAVFLQSRYRGYVYAGLSMNGWILQLALIFSLLVLTAFHTKLSLKRIAGEPGRDSIRKGFNALPDGICFAHTDGRPILVNRKMAELHYQLVGRDLQNAGIFWDSLCRSEVLPDNGRFLALSVPTYRVGDGQIWSFSRSMLYLDGQEIFQLRADNVTQLFMAAAEIREENDKLRDVQNRLKEYGDVVTELTRQEEILAAKIRIHDDLGETILRTRVYLGQSVQEKETGTELILAWERNIAMLRQQAVSDKTTDAAKQIRAAGKTIGLSIKTVGELPEENSRVMRFITTAARECMTNAVKYAKAKELTIGSEREKGGWVITVTNDGIPPAGPIREGGGLSGLRSMVEKAGGSLTLRHDPRFLLTMEIPD